MEVRTPICSLLQEASQAQKGMIAARDLVMDTAKRKRKRGGKEDFKSLGPKK